MHVCMAFARSTPPQIRSEAGSVPGDRVFHRTALRGNRLAEPVRNSAAYFPLSGNRVQHINKGLFA
jgi:hypothetical protein